MLKCERRLDLLTSLYITSVTSSVTFTFLLGYPMDQRRYSVSFSVASGKYRERKPRPLSSTRVSIRYPSIILGGEGSGGWKGGTAALSSEVEVAGKCSSKLIF